MRVLRILTRSGHWHSRGISHVTGDHDLDLIVLFGQDFCTGRQQYLPKGIDARRNAHYLQH
jgi:hypothetical protein